MPLPTLFICHGGGPWPFIPEAAATWAGLGDYLRGLDAALGRRPKAVLVISGHWEEARPTVNVAERPPLLFDYYNFPPHTYRLSYPAPGSPEVAARAKSLLEAAGFPAGEEPARGFDHGVFIPFMLIYPDADVPIVQLSLEVGLDPARHIALGRALAPLRDEDVLIVGSGLSYHNLRALFADDPLADAEAERFDAWLAQAVESDPAAREARLADWARAPGARASHPRAEHLLPLMVAAGAAGEDRGRRVYAERVLGKALSGFQFGS
jgi:aromatic ring-opening dioxygenase catalytic subunit (LigB family)